jgi:zinc protease
MNRFNKVLFGALFILFLSTVAMFAQSDDYKDLNELIPADKTIRQGTLKNGMKYYIKKNTYPEKRMELRLIVNAGSVEEDNDQKGVAHFLEHMCFNGTKNFPKNELVNFLEKTGVKFGAHLNAYTSFDRTVYMLMLPSQDKFIREKGFRVLADWASEVSFEESEINKERGVVREEERVRKSGNSKAQQELLKTLFYGSKLAERLPIGDTNIIRTAPKEAFTRFYKDWYRPDLMAVVAVGDFDEDKIEETIKEFFEPITAKSAIRQKDDIAIKMNDQPLVQVASNKEVTAPVVQVIYKRPTNTYKNGTYGDYREKFVDILVSGMINRRLQEVTQKANPPFVQAGVQADKEFGRFYNFGLFSVLKAEEIKRGYANAVTELFRAKLGFSESEMKRVNDELLSNLEESKNEKDKTPSRALADEYIRNYLEQEAIPGIDRDYGLFLRWSKEVTIDECNKRIQSLITDKNIVITLTAPEKDGVKIPTGDELVKIYNEISKKKLEPYKDDASSVPYFSAKPTPGSISKKSRNDKQDITTWELSNGATVSFKKTDFKKDEVMFNAYSWGGHSLCSDEEFHSASACDDVVTSCGIGDMNKNQMDKAKAGKNFYVTPYVAELNEGLNGNSGVKDLEMMFQTIYMYFTAPRVDKDGFDAYVSNSKSWVNQQMVNPNSVYQDTITAIMGGYHMRKMPITGDYFTKIDMNKSLEIYKKRFAGAGDFKFFFVGNIDEAKFEEYVNKYIASLPAGSKETYKEIKINEPKGKLTKVVNKGSDPKGVITVSVPGKFDFNAKNLYMMSSLIQVLQIRLREEIREEKGGAYGVGVSPSYKKIPSPSYKVNVSFTCPPERVDELKKVVYDVFDELKSKDITDDNLTKVKETQKRERETQLKENSTWLNWMYSASYNNEDINQIDLYDSFVQSLTKNDIKAAAKMFLNNDEAKEFILLPERN